MPQSKTQKQMLTVRFFPWEKMQLQMAASFDEISMEEFVRRATRTVVAEILGERESVEAVEKKYRELSKKKK